MIRQVLMMINKHQWTIDTSSDEETAASKRRKCRKAAVSGSSSDNDDSSDINEPLESIAVGRTTHSIQSTRATTNKPKVVQNENDSDESESSDKKGKRVIKPEEQRVRVRGSLRSGINFKDSTLNPEREEELPEYEKEWYDEFIQEDDEHDVGLSGKLVLMLEILANAEVVGDKVLVFSQSLTSLDLIESTLGGGRIDGNELNWCHGVDYFRMDGSTPIHKRKRWTEIFNDPENERY